MNLDYITAALAALVQHTSIQHSLSITCDPKRPDHYRYLAAVVPCEQGGAPVAHAYAASAELAIAALNEQIRARSPLRNPSAYDVCLLLLHNIDMSTKYGWDYDLVAKMWEATEGDKS